MVLDRMPDGGWAPGGPSLYAARMALALGAEVTLITRLIPGYPAHALEGITVAGLPAADVPRYVNTYDEYGNRSQLLLGEGEPIPARAIGGGQADLLLFAPAYHELDAPPRDLPAVTAVCYQGMLRDRDGDQVVPRAEAWRAIRKFAAPGLLGFLSEEDTADARSLALQAAATGATCFVTHGSRGATRYEGRTVTHRSAFASAPIDPTGAGDAFATALAVRFAESGNACEAFAFAAMAGALAVEGRGLAGIPRRAEIEARLLKAAA